MTKDKNIFILNIYYMLTYAFRELKQNNYEEIAGEDFDNIQQLFAEILIKGISCQLKQGIFKQYIIRKDSLPTLRGKLDLNATIQNKLCRKQEIGCEYDELSGFFSNFSTKPHILYEGAIFLRKFNIKN